MNAVDKFEQFEWLTHGITAKSPNFEPQARSTGEKPLNYEDRLGAIATNYRHIKTGNSYALIVVANKGSSKPNFPEIAVYQSLKDGVVYARPYTEFKEKFEKA